LYDSPAYVPCCSKSIGDDAGRYEDDDTYVSLSVGTARRLSGAVGTLISTVFSSRTLVSCAESRLDATESKTDALSAAVFVTVVVVVVVVVLVVLSAVSSNGVDCASMECCTFSFWLLLFMLVLLLVVALDRFDVRVPFLRAGSSVGDDADAPAVDRRLLGVVVAAFED
jgi:hypothetical protein